MTAISSGQTTRRRRLGLVSRVFAASITASLGCALVAATATTAPVKAQSIRDLQAEYDILFNGVSIGGFNFRTQMSGQRYTATSRGKGRLLFGAIKWTGTFSGSGRIVTDEVYPRRFTQTFESRRRLAFRTKKRFKSAKLEFDRKGIVTADLKPPLKTHERVPLRARDKRGVYDPIAAIVAMTQTNVARPCSARLPVFEGRQRFDIVLKPKRRQTIRDARGNTYPGFVCSVRYVQVAGHRKKDIGSAMTKPDAIELVLRRVRAAEVLVPHELRINTRLGTATVRAKKIDIRTNGRGRIVLSN